MKKNYKKVVNVIGAGLAGCEAAWQAVSLGVSVNLYEMKPLKYTEAHTSPVFAELVCSNSFKANSLDNATGLLKEELRQMGSLIMSCADGNKVPAGGALAVDRETFSSDVTEKVKGNELISVINREVKGLNDFDEDEIVVIATGPLTSDSLADSIFNSQFGRQRKLSFYDAAAPVIYKDSINMDIAFKASRYGKGGDDYVNCGMDKLQYENFYNALINAETAEVHGFDEENVYEGCMPVEVMAKRGVDSLRYGPLKPVGLNKEGTPPYWAVIQLRQDNSEGTLYNLVGFQTRLKFPEQKRVFGMIPGLKEAEFARYGVMHRNTYLCSPGILNENYQVISKPNLFFAGQITGVEGYIESVSSGLVAGINAALLASDGGCIRFPTTTAIGSLCNYVSSYGGSDFQPMGSNFGIINTSGIQIKDKKLKKRLIAEKALSEICSIRKYMDVYLKDFAG
ncbi:MAG: methylenetetrahydrofolate--tRNA-(uracil(54)-C(5))-methyltransferase (FADH(2)-oxidizing) TrmFO [Clostridiales bacterium]|jgi:methylenetetrahydrofolate--tRNA-(uracil-5-)-methyltransferase|nr:methylenetetrahydrofolate--tRNA-(uracil(54)-C(5))-methyltransferase (FADH(2)-oxidizing) TrmFO [Clostridiales bacterium]